MWWRRSESRNHESTRHHFRVRCLCHHPILGYCEGQILRESCLGCSCAVLAQVDWTVVLLVQALGQMTFSPVCLVAAGQHVRTAKAIPIVFLSIV